MKNYISYIILVLLLSITTIKAQVGLEDIPITFLNTGQMNVAPNGATGVSLFVPASMRHLLVAGRTVEIIHNGITELGGNFFQDSNTTIFQVGADTKTTSGGIFRFVSSRGQNRTISTQSTDITLFDRGTRYIAFPHIQISTNDSIILPGKMGVDATTLQRVNLGTGHFVLRSDVVSSMVFGGSQNAYDASLRITRPGSSSQLVSPGCVVVERNMSLYRPEKEERTQLFGFATPFYNTQLSGYFAGNWVRRPQNRGDYGHTTYVYGNKDNAPADNIIDGDQYIYLAAETLTPSQAYLIKPRPFGFDYGILQQQYGLWYTGEQNPSLYDKGKYYFDGKVYTVGPYAEQLFAEDELYTNVLENVSLENTVNILIGNSYTCPISTYLLAERMLESELVFSPYIYVFMPGSATYQPLSISYNPHGDPPIVVEAVSEIPAMSIFMLRLAKQQQQNGRITLGKDILRHADVAHNNPATAPSVNGEARNASAQRNNIVTENQVTFKVSPIENDNIYDLTAIGLRSAASYASDDYDMAKAYVNDNDLFQMYTLSTSKSKLSANAVPLNADTVILAFKPSKIDGDYKISAKYIETLQTDGLWLYDMKLHKLVDLKNTETYSFASKSYDNPERFIVYFKKPTITDIDVPDNNLELFYNENKLKVKLLIPEDMGSRIDMFDVQGRLIKTATVNNYPEMTIPVNKLIEGVYFVKLLGQRNANAKFLKNNK